MKDQETTAKRRWTEDEVTELRRLYATGLKAEEIARKIGRPLRAIYVKAHKLGLPNKEQPKAIHLNGEETEWLRKAYPHVRTEICSLRLGISPRSVVRIARKLHLNKTPEFMRECQRKTAEAAQASHQANGTYPPKGVVNENLKKGEAYRFQPGHPYRNHKIKASNEGL
jgi:hypothetical protein